MTEQPTDRVPANRHEAIARGIEAGLRDMGADLTGCTPSMLTGTVLRELGRVPAATDADRLARLRAIVRPVITWYEKTLAEGEPDSSFLYDTTAESFERMLSRGDFQSIVEILREKAGDR